MSDKIIIAVDAMGGDNSPKKIIDGIKISLKSSRENFFHLYGKEDLLNEEISKKIRDFAILFLACFKSVDIKSSPL